MMVEDYMKEVCRVIDVSSSYVPFTVKPDSGVILAGKTLDVVVKFSPLEVGDYTARLVCR